MKFKITKLYRVNSNGEVVDGSVIMESPGGQMRRLEGMIGGPASSGSHISDIRLGESKCLQVTIDHDVTFSIAPASE